jgi:Tol biopolymer transport system component
MIGIERKLFRIIAFVAVAASSGLSGMNRSCQHRLTLCQQITFGTFAELAPTVSPDNGWLAFEYFDGERSGIQLWVMPTDGPFSSARPIVNDSKYHAGISWSPDSAWIAYVTNEPESASSLTISRIEKTNIHTHQTVRLTQFPKGMAPGDYTSWSKNGQIAFELDNQLYALNDSGGEAYALMELGKSFPIISPAAPITWSPDAMRIAFLAQDSNSRDSVNLWIADPVHADLTPVLTNEHICCISWPYPDRLLVSRFFGDQDIGIWLLSLHDRKFQRLTAGPVDMAGTLDTNRDILFFNHSEALDVSFERATFMVARMHIWSKSVRELLKR